MTINFKRYAAPGLGGARALVVGLKKSGIESALFLIKHGARLTVTDIKDEAALAGEIARLDATGAPYKKELGSHSFETFRDQDILVLSPGVPADSEFVAAALEAGATVVSEIEFASWFCRAPIVAVTGTNGKTTTTTLCHRMLSASGKFGRVFLGGNIGIPFISFAEEASPGDVVVLEISSFQMEWAETFAPRAALLLNVTEDHLNRHGTIEKYVDMKMRVFDKQAPDAFAFINADDRLVSGLASRIPSKVMRFTVADDPSCGAFVRGGELFVADGAGRAEKVISARDIGIIGPHNLSNSAAAAAMAYNAFGVPPSAIASVLSEFKGVSHRLELVASVRGVAFYNDSKATNEDSAITALRAFSTPVILIAGGSDKGSDFMAFSAMVVSSPVRRVFVIGEVAAKMVSALSAAGFAGAERRSTLEECVRDAYAAAVPGDTILLSPACASLDMFRNYEHRGEVFVAEAARIAGGAA